jgi:hypothetical protein
MKAAIAEESGQCLQFDLVHRESVQCLDRCALERRRTELRHTLEIYAGAHHANLKVAGEIDLQLNTENEGALWGRRFAMVKCVWEMAGSLERIENSLDKRAA